MWSYHFRDYVTDRFDANCYLYITRAMNYFDLVEAHGGHLDWRANEPRGSCFYFILPAVNNGASA